MSMKAAGYTCPYCGYDHEMNITGWIKDDDGFMVGTSLDCPKCHYEWIEAHRE